MRQRQAVPSIRIAMMALVILACSIGLMAQTPQIRPGTLRGQVTDASGGSVADAMVLVTTPTGETLARTTDMNGAFELTDLAPGNYHLAVTVAGFAPNEQGVRIVAGQVQQITVSLDVATQQQEITVSEVAPTVDTSPSSNAGAVVMQGNDLEALSDDPDQLMADLQALAGPSAGPNGGQIFIDGFTGGQLPPKSSIREIRINSNPFSAEFDRMGFGRIEILTRPGSDTLRGRFNVQGNTSGLNTGSPFVSEANQVPYNSVSYDGNIGGSLGSGASFAFSAFRRNISDSAIVNAIILDPTTLDQAPFNAGIENPQTRTNVSPRVDYQINQDNTLTVRYQFSRDVRSNEGIGGFSLATQGYDILNTEQSLQLSDTQILGERAVNETRFRYISESDSQTAQFSEPAIRVTGAFTGGGSTRGSLSDNKRYELQNYTSFIAGPHMLRFGGRVRANRLVDSSTSNFNGTFNFPSITAYQLTEQGLEQGLTMDEIRANGGGPNQFSISAGNPEASANTIDAGLYLQDDWRLRSNLTLSAGLRFETQNNIPDHVDVAPRIGLAWSIGKGNRPTVIRTGFGMFYNRFDDGNVLQLERFNGVTQQQYIVTSPDFYPTIPALTSLGGTQTSPTVYQISPDLRSPYIMQVAASVERQLTRVTNLSVNYVGSRGVHSLLTNNINAPLPGSITTANPTGVRPFGNVGNIYQYQSNGSFRQNQLITSLNIRAGGGLSLFGRYVLNYAHNYTATGGFPSDPYNFRLDDGRANNDIRHRVNIGGTMTLPWAMRLSPFVTLQSSSPFNITVGQDINGDSQFNDRPAFATSQTLPENLVATPYGNFDRAPAAGATLIPINYGSGTSRVAVNLRLGKTFSFGGRSEQPAAAGGAGGPGGGFGGPRPGGGGPGGGGGRGGGGFGGGGGGRGAGRYNITLNVDARNIFNKVNLGNPIGNLSSPLFGQANSVAGGPFSTGAAVRRVNLSLAFSF